MHIAYLHLHPQRPGEAPATHVDGIVSGLRRLGHEVDVFCPTFQGTGPAARIRGIRRSQYDAVSADAEVLYVRQHVLATSVAVAARRRGLHVVQEVNGGALDYTMAHPSLRPVRPLIDWELAAQLRAAAGVVTVSDGLAAWARDRGAARVAVIPNAAPAALASAPIEPRPPSGLEGSHYVVFFGALARWQGIRTLLSATRDPRWPSEVRLVVIGGGALRTMVGRAAQASSGRVHHFDAVPREELHRVVAGALASLVPVHDQPRTRLGFSSIKAFESLACGTPVIVSDLHDLLHLIDDTGGGLAFRADDQASLAATVARLASDASLRASLGRAGRAAVADRHTWDHRAADTAAFLHSVIAP